MSLKNVMSNGRLLSVIFVGNSPFCQVFVPKQRACFKIFSVNYLMETKRMSDLEQTQPSTRAKKLGELIQNARELAGHSPADCAAVLNISTASFELAESGEHSLSLPDLEALAIFLDVPMGYFWGTAPLASPQQPDYETYLTIRHRLIAVMLRQLRLKAKASAQDVAEAVGMETAVLETYESGDTPVPYFQLEALCRYYDASLDHFVEKNSGPLGRHEAEQRLQQLFNDLSPEMRDFVTNPSNVSFLETARRLSMMDVQGLRSIGESILDITY